MFRLEEYLVPDERMTLGIRDQFISGNRTYRRDIIAARLLGNSMTDISLHSGDICLLSRGHFDHFENNIIAAVMEAGDEEGSGAWALKKLVIERDRRYSRNTYDDEIDMNEPVIRLTSLNREGKFWVLDPNGRYRVVARFVRKISGTFVGIDSLPESIRRQIRGR